MPVSFFVLLLIQASFAFSQTNNGAKSGRLTIANGTVSAVTTFDTPRLLHERIVAGHPYSADRVIEHTQTLIDGTHIDQKHETAREYRDSEGRIRTEQKLFNGPRAPAIAKDELPTLVQIFDPVRAIRTRLIRASLLLTGWPYLPSQVNGDRCDLVVERCLPRPPVKQLVKEVSYSARSSRIL